LKVIVRSLCTESLALLGSPLAVPVSDRIPEFNVEAQCKATVDVDKSMGLSEPESLANCVRDEMDARQQLTAVWQSNPAPVRDRCEGEATAGGFKSYVDLLTCIQMADLANPQSTATSLKGASKNRNKK